MEIADILSAGKENAVTRERLCVILNQPDRTVRRLIQEARDRGVLIMNDQDGAGYYLSEDLSDLKRQYNRGRARAMSILRQQKYLKRKIKELEQADQMSIGT